MNEAHTCVIGAGIVGLAVAFHLVRSGARVTIIDRDPNDAKASFGNAGGIATPEVFPASAPGVFWRLPGWILDPLGPISVHPAHALKLLPWLMHFARSAHPKEVERISHALAALNSRAYSDLAFLLNTVGLGGELQTTGALTLYESAAGFRRDAAEWACKRAHGVIAEDLTASEARELEPALGELVHRAVLTPQWALVSDPERIALGLRDWLFHEGVEVLVGDVLGITRRAANGLVLNVAHGSPVTAEKVVIAGGAWSGVLARSLGDRVLLESERGYTATLTAPRIRVTRELIFADCALAVRPNLPG
jgi:D-amino-acid dehydrogenase